MKILTSFIVMAAIAFTLGLNVPQAVAQDGGQRDGGARDGQRDGDARRGGDRQGRWDNMSEEQREQMRERFSERFEEMRREQAQRMREDLELTEEEFSAIQPMIEKVQQLSGESMLAGRNMFGNRGGRGGRGPGGFGFSPFGEENMSSQGKTLSDATEALRETLDNKDASSDEVKSRLAAMRQARIAMQDALRQAREELRGFVTPRQEATLVLQGILD